MKLYVYRRQTNDRKQFLYEIGVHVKFTDEEIELAEKYQGFRNKFRVHSNPGQINGLEEVNMEMLSGKDVLGWRANSLYSDMVVIPSIITGHIKQEFSAYRAREAWGKEAQVPEEIDIAL